jgi:hypothetical protein
MPETDENVTPETPAHVEEVPVEVPSPPPPPDPIAILTERVNGIEAKITEGFEKITQSLIPATPTAPEVKPEEEGVKHAEEIHKEERPGTNGEGAAPAGSKTTRRGIGKLTFRG